MAKFKKGDRVRYLGVDGASHQYPPVDAEAVVVRPWYSNGWGEFMEIKWDRKQPEHGRRDGGYHEEHFELVKPKKEKKPSQAYRGNGKHEWELVTPSGNTMRLRVPGGYIYRDPQGQWAVFAPLPEVVKHKV